MRELRLCSQKPVEILVGAKSEQTVRLWQFQEWHKLHVQSTCGEPSGDIHRCGLTSRLASNDILNVCSYPVELHLLNLWCLIYIYIYSIWYYLHLFPAVCTLYVLEIYIYILGCIFYIIYGFFRIICFLMFMLFCKCMVCSPAVLCDASKDKYWRIESQYADGTMVDLNRVIPSFPILSRLLASQYCNMVFSGQFWMNNLVLCCKYLYIYIIWIPSTDLCCIWFAPYASHNVVFPDACTFAVPAMRRYFAVNTLSQATSPFRPCRIIMQLFCVLLIR